MTMHWQWAMDRALSFPDASHFFVLTDRMLFKHGALSTLLTAVDKYPDELISFTYDRIYDYGRPIKYLPLPRSGHLYRLDTADLLRQSSRMIFRSCLPRMLNCLAPRTLLEAMTDRYGSIFDSVSPDYCFCYRVLGMIPSMLFYDESLLVNYAQDRSNGASFSRGVASKDSIDFAQHLDSGPMNAQAPIPEIPTVGNAVVHEYCSVKSQSDSDRYPDLSIRSYLDFLAAEVDAFLDRAIASAARDILVERGWHPTVMFRLNALRRKLISVVLAVRQRKFETRFEAIRYATTYESKAMPWLGPILRRYGNEVLPLR